jgi:hypothetical protein
MYFINSLHWVRTDVISKKKSMENNPYNDSPYIEGLFVPKRRLMNEGAMVPCVHVRLIICQRGLRKFYMVVEL